MQLTHRFTVPASVVETWAAFNDIESVAACFPGAVVSSVEGDEFQGSCKVKLGPIALVYNGSGRFTEKDETAHRMVIEAKGKDKRGNGTAGADVVATMTADGESSTTVEVVTDLAITGKPAQFGRGVIQDVSDKLLQKFVDCLQQKVGAPAQPEEAATAATPEPETEPAGGSSAAAPAAAPAPAPAPAPPTASDDDALDLGAAVLPVLVKSYGKQALAGLLVLGLVVALVRRCTGRR